MKWHLQKSLYPNYVQFIECGGGGVVILTLYIITL